MYYSRLYNPQCATGHLRLLTRKLRLLSRFEFLQVFVNAGRVVVVVVVFPLPLLTPAYVLIAWCYSLVTCV